MLICKVVGNVVATQKQECYVGHKLLLVREIGLDGQVSGPEMVAVDGAEADAGVGDIVLVIQEGGSARLVSRIEGLKPVDLAIIAVVDSIETSQGSLFQYGQSTEG